LVPGWHRPPSATKVRGFGLEGDPPAEEVLLLLAGRERPSSPDHLLAGNRVAALVALAALSESLDYIADRMVSVWVRSGREGETGGDAGGRGWKGSSWCGWQGLKVEGSVREEGGAGEVAGNRWWRWRHSANPWTTLLIAW
jgi:hypothetical protein